MALSCIFHPFFIIIILSFPVGFCHVFVLLLNRLLSGRVTLYTDIYKFKNESYEKLNSLCYLAVFIFVIY